PERSFGYQSPSTPPTSNGFSSAQGPTQPAKPGLLERLTQQFHGEIEKAKELAIGAAVGVVRDIAKQALPKLAPQIDEIMNSATTKMGGEPIHQTLVEPETDGPSRR